MGFSYLIFAVLLVYVLGLITKTSSKILINKLKNLYLSLKRKEKKYYFRGEEIIEPKPEDIRECFKYTKSVVIYPPKRVTTPQPLPPMTRQWKPFKGKYYRFINEQFIKDNFLSKTA